MSERLRVLIADDERPARSLLAAMLATFDDVELIAAAEDGATALEAIERLQPDLAILDLQMPELDGLEVVRMLKKNKMPLVAFVTAYDEHAVQAFELNAVDYLLKPIDVVRLRDCVNRAIERLERAGARSLSSDNIETATKDIDAANPRLLRRVPIRRRDEVIFIPVEAIAAVVAQGELLHITTAKNERHSIYYRLKDLEARLDPELFFRLSRGTIVNLSMITKVTPLPGGMYRVFLSNGLELGTSRLHSKIMRERLLRL
jgi:two-component system, LytTR family, response regulator